MAALVFLLFLVVLDVAVLAGRTVDSRDRDYTLARVFARVGRSGYDGR